MKAIFINKKKRGDKMSIIDIITKKKQKESLTEEEINYVIEGYVNGMIKDYQMSALLMAITLNGMDEKEINFLTDAMIKSGETLDLSNLSKLVDKHSTGGVGDKTTLVIVPIIASCGANTLKMSGKGLGYTGGTIDKLESIPEINLSMSTSECVEQVKNIGEAIIMATGNIVPADKKIYALRDVTGTTNSLPLIASSIMSKKIASGCPNIVIDVKVGNGALIKNIESARALAKLMINIGKRYDRKVVCLLTNMDIPLGDNIGNSLEVEEAMQILLNSKEGSLRELCVELASNMLELALNISYGEAHNKVIESIESGKAYQKFLELIKYQHGKLDNLPKSSRAYDVKSTEEGYLTKLDAYKLGKLSCLLGSGRINKEDVIDYTAGIIIHKKINDYVNKDDIIYTMYTNKDISNLDLKVFEISSDKVEEQPLIYEVIK